MAHIIALTHVDRAERHRRIAAAIGSGSTPQEQAERFGLHPNYVCQIAKLYGVNRRRGRPSARRGVA